MICIENIGWAATGTMLQGIGTVIGAIAVIVAAFIGANTFKGWRQQKLSERRIEQAERILTAAYRVRRDLSRVRSPMMHGHELADAEDSLKKNGEWDKITGGDKERQRFTITQAYYNRLGRTRDNQLALEECQPMARALFGEQLEKALEKLNHQFWTVRVFVDANHHDRSGADQDFRRKIDTSIWEGYPSSEENEVDKTIAAQMNAIEDVCVPVLRLEGPIVNRKKG